MQESITSDKITLTQYGFQSATNSQSNPESIDGYLNKVYDKFLEDQKLDETGVKNRISRLREEVILEKSRKNDLQAEITTYNANKIDKENEIQELELERIDIKNGEGELIYHYPASLKELAQCTPVYEELPGWSEDITGCRTLEELPENARNYVRRVQETVGVRISTFSVGPDRNQTNVLENVWASI